MTTPCAFEASRAVFETLIGFFAGPEAAELTHGELEARLKTDGFDLLRQVLQDHFDLRAAREERALTPVGSDGRPRPYLEAGHARPLHTIFGQLSVTRLAYRAKGATNLYPADATANLPVEVHSHGLRELAALEAAKGSFDDAVDTIARSSGAGLAKRQVQDLSHDRGRGLRGLLRDPPRQSGRNRRGRGHLGRWEGNRYATRGAASRHGSGGSI
jgi:hypothetical protein